MIPEICLITSLQLNLGVNCGSNKRANMCSMCPNDTAIADMPGVQMWCKGECKYNEERQLCYSEG